MHESSDGIAEELERQLQLTLAAGAIAARNALATRQHTLERAKRNSEQASRAAQARIDAERTLAAERLRAVLDDAWWEAASPQQIADMWQQANSWRDAQEGATPTLFDRAAFRIREEVSERSGLDLTQIFALAELQQLEHDYQATREHAPAERREDAFAAKDAPRAFDDPRRREQLRARLAAADLPETAVDARTLADLGQAREAEQAARAPVTSPAEPRTPAPQRAGRKVRRL